MINIAYIVNICQQYAYLALLELCRNTRLMKFTADYEWIFDNTVISFSGYLVHAEMYISYSKYYRNIRIYKLVILIDLVLLQLYICLH